GHRIHRRDVPAPPLTQAVAVNFHGPIEQCPRPQSRPLHLPYPAVGWPPVGRDARSGGRIPRCFIKDVGPDRAKHNIPKIYDFLDAQPWSWNSRRFKNLQEYRQDMKDDPSYRPTLALWSKRKTDALIAKILKLMRADPGCPWWPR